MAVYEILPHTADTGIVTYGDSLEDVIGNAAFAMFDLMYDLDGAGEGVAVEFVFDDVEPPDLLVNVLSELLAESEADDIACSAVDASTRGAHLIVTASAHPIDDLDPVGPPIKAVTYHDLRCEPTEDGWLAQVIFDV